MPHGAALALPHPLCSCFQVDNVPEDGEQDQDEEEPGTGEASSRDIDDNSLSLQTKVPPVQLHKAAASL